MRFLHVLALLMVGLSGSSAMAWGSNSLLAYRAFENMPEVSGAPSATVETLESFLRAEEYTVEALLASQEAWAAVNIDKYPVRPASLAFKADGARSDEARKLAFLRALRVSPESRFALYVQLDPWNPAAGTALAFSAISPLAEAAGSASKYLGLKPGDSVQALLVLASASSEPCLGLDINLWEDNASEWGRSYGFGAQPYGNPMQAQASQIPFHSAYLHESRTVYLGIPSIKRSLVLIRSHQYSTLASLAFRTGHAYWGWRFAGLALHYLQDLTQPYHASYAPGESGLKLLAAHAMALSALPGMENDLLQLQANRSEALEKYLSEQLLAAAANRQETALEKALHNSEKDRNYPDWSERYLRDVVSLQASRAAPAVAQALVATLPAAYVSDPAFDFYAREATINLHAELSKRGVAEPQKLDALLADLMANFGAHSRNALRGILRASDPF